MKKAIIVVGRKHQTGDDLVHMFEYDSHQEDQAIAKYKRMEASEEYNDLYFAHIIKESH